MQKGKQAQGREVACLGLTAGQWQSWDLDSGRQSPDPTSSLQRPKCVRDSYGLLSLAANRLFCPGASEFETLGRGSRSYAFVTLSKGTVLQPAHLMVAGTQPWGAERLGGR